MRSVLVCLSVWQIQGLPRPTSLAVHTRHRRVRLQGGSRQQGKAGMTARWYSIYYRLAGGEGDLLGCIKATIVRATHYIGTQFSPLARHLPLLLLLPRDIIFRQCVWKGATGIPSDIGVTGFRLKNGSRQWVQFSLGHWAIVLSQNRHTHTRLP